jgi:arsenate reductase
VTGAPQPFRVLFLCTGNSARSQMAEAILNARGAGRYEAQSAGSHPAARVNPLAIETLRRAGIKWAGHPPRSVDGLERERWDLVITVCDNAREACPIFPGAPAMEHWGMEDPAEVTGTDAEKLRAFEQARELISQRVDRLLAGASAERLSR